jgi:hypothetical protein
MRGRRSWYAAQQFACVGLDHLGGAFFIRDSYAARASRTPRAMFSFPPGVCTLMRVMTTLWPFSKCATKVGDMLIGRSLLELFHDDGVAQAAG